MVGMLSATAEAPAGAPASAPRDGPRLPYLPGVDGLRAVAVVSVLLYHAEFSWMIGGYLGVEVFFVISGYLITSLLFAERSRTGGVKLGTFYIRRARRLLPALFVTLAGVMVLSLIFLPDQVASLRGDIVAAVGYATNWYFIVAQKSYFETATPSLIKHLWSLAIEEQFYLIWPLLFTGLLKLVGRKRLIALIVAGAALSSIWMAWLYAHLDASNPDALNRVYMGTDTRAAGLLIGAALALTWSPWRLGKSRTGKGAPLVLDVVGVAALGLLVYALYGLSEFSSSLYQGGFLKVSVLTAIVIAVVAHPAARLGRVLGCAPMRWIGLRSYGIYLYHFPIFVLIKPDPLIPNPNLYLYFVVRVAITMVVVELSYRYIEMPIRRGALGKAYASMKVARSQRPAGHRTRWALGTAGLAVMLIALSVLVVRAQPPSRADVVAVGASSPDDFGGALDVNGKPLPTADPNANDNEVASGDPNAGVPIGDPNAPPSSLDASTTAPGATDSTATATTVASTPPTAGGPPVTNPHGAIRCVGDSVMLGASPTIKAALGPESGVDAVVGRQVSVGIQIFQKWQQLGQIPDVIVVQLGNNGTFTDQQFDDIMTALKGVRRVIFVDVKVPRRWQDTNNTVIGNGVSRYPNTVLVDWYSASIDHPEYFWSDGMHLRPEGANAYANLILSKL
jgi:peptidoglycan/LPS O-acetylase OafA/YrhL